MPLKLDNVSVLVIEDLRPMRELMVFVLTALGFKKIFTADNGANGFQEFNKSKPDIVITDWEMEPVNGIELIHKIRRSPKSHNKTVPIILVSGYSAKSRVIQGRDMGVTEFLTKPFTGNDLAKRIMHIINQPRDFVLSDKFTGPDRRRRKGEEYQGPKRRSVERPKSKVSKSESKDEWNIIIE